MHCRPVTHQDTDNPSQDADHHKVTGMGSFAPIVFFSPSVSLPGIPTSLRSLLFPRLPAFRGEGASQRFPRASGSPHLPVCQRLPVASLKEVLTQRMSSSKDFAQKDPPKKTKFEPEPEPTTHASGRLQRSQHKRQPQKRRSRLMGFSDPFKHPGFIFEQS